MNRCQNKINLHQSHSEWLFLDAEGYTVMEKYALFSALFNMFAFFLTVQCCGYKPFICVYYAAYLEWNY